MLPSSPSTPGDNLQAQGNHSRTQDRPTSDLLGIEPSALQARVQFRQPLLCGVHETYSPDEYDRTSIKVTRHNLLALPDRGDRIYSREEDEPIVYVPQEERYDPSAVAVTHHGSVALRGDRVYNGGEEGASNILNDLQATSSLEDLIAQCTLLSTSDNLDQSQLSMVPTGDDETTLPLRLRRPATPMPTSFPDASDSEDEGSGPCHADNYAPGIPPPLMDVSVSDDLKERASPPSIGTLILSFRESNFK